MHHEFVHFYLCSIFWASFLFSHSLLFSHMQTVQIWIVFSFNWSRLNDSFISINACTDTHIFMCNSCFCFYLKKWRGLLLGTAFSAKGFFAGSTEATQSWLSGFPWINNPGLFSIKDNNRFLDLRHPSPTPAPSTSLWTQHPMVKRQARCTVTIKHYTRRVETTVVKQVLISHPFPILLSCLELLHMLWIYCDHTYIPMQMFKDVQILIQKWNLI